MRLIYTVLFVLINKYFYKEQVFIVGLEDQLAWHV